MERKTAGLLGILIAVSALLRPLASSSSAPTSSPEEKKPFPAALVPPFTCDASETRGPWDAVRALFINLQSTPITNPNQPPCRLSAASPGWGAIPHNAAIDFLLVAVADPEQTRLALTFDRVIESIIWSTGDAGYVFDRYWIPWSTAIEREPLTQADEECRRKIGLRRRREPGLMIFRRVAANDSQQFLFVWLIGEAPTSGLDKWQFQNAIAYSMQLQSYTSGTPQKNRITQIHLVGPNFSGSLDLLASDIRAITDRCPDTAFFVISGFATDYDAICRFKNVLPEVDYESTVENDKRASELFFNYVSNQWRHWVKLGEIALLSEDETIHGDIPHIPKSDPHEWLTLRYPREIARLRNAASLASSDVSKQDAASQIGVPLTLGDAPRGPAIIPDTIETFSTQQSPASQEAVLLNIASTLRRDRAAYAGIITTDVRDALFLTRFLRTANPDTRIFTLNSDLLFLREAETAPLVGTLSITEYPLFSRNQHWTQGQHGGGMPRRLQFPARSAEATYNACRRALYQIEAGHGSPGAAPADPRADTYLEYQRPFADPGDVPPIWLTVLGRDGYWPVALLDDPPAPSANHSDSTLQHLPQGSRNENREDLHPEEPSLGWLLLFWLGCFFCIAHVIYVAYLQRAKEYTPRQGFLFNALSALLSAYPTTRPRSHERPFLLAATVALMSALAVFSLPMSQFLSFPWARPYLIVAAICLFLLICLAVWLSFGKQADKFIVVMVWGLAICALWIWVDLILRSAYKTGYFMAYRSLYLGNGVAPGIPIILVAAAYYGWAWINLNREVAARDRRAMLKHHQDRNAPVSELCTLMYRTDDQINDISSGRIRLFALVLLGLWFLLLWPPSTLRSVEYYLYDVLYTLILLTLYWCICLVCVQFFRCWRHFKTFLEALERHPVRNAFSRLPKEIYWIPLVSVRPRKSLLVSSRIQDCLKNILKQLSPISLLPDRQVMDCLRRSHDRSETLIQKLEQTLTTNSYVDPLLYGQLQQYFDDAEQCITQHLRTNAWADGDSDSLRQENQHRPCSPLSPPEKLGLLEEEYVALRWLLFIRYVMRQLRNLLGFIIAGFIISVISLSAYPFRGHRWIGLSNVAILIAIGIVVVMVLAGMDKDAILSRLTESKANELGKTFFFRLVQFGALPVLTVLTAQFPTINRILFSWLRPVLEALK
jgi:hypothetical protein